MYLCIRAFPIPYDHMSQNIAIWKVIKKIFQNYMPFADFQRGNLTLFDNKLSLF